MQSSKEWVEITAEARTASKDLPTRGTENFHERTRRCSDRASLNASRSKGEWE
jgi:hypothetical protein